LENHAQQPYSFRPKPGIRISVLIAFQASAARAAAYFAAHWRIAKSAGRAGLPIKLNLKVPAVCTVGSVKVFHF
jgi:hypothetical protein